MRIGLVLTLILCTFYSLLLSQSAEEALELSGQGPYGTARSMATMNTLDALGADFSAIIANPAGIGNYRRSEFAFTTGVEIFSNDSRVLSSRKEQSNSSSSLQLDQMGIILTSRSRKNVNWKQFNFGFNYQKLDTYQKKYAFDDVSNGSITESFLERADGFVENELDPFYEGLAHGTALIVDDTEPTRYFIDLPEDPMIQKRDEYELSGSSRTNVFSFGANYDNRLLFGVNLGFPAFRYEISQDYFESDPSDDYAVFQSLDYKRRGISKGNGIYAQLGLIYNLNRALRLSVSSQTPTRYEIEITSYTADLVYRYVEQGIQQELESLSPDQFFEYSLNTPWQHRIGLGSVIQRKGFVSASLMYKDYSQLKYDFGDAREDEINEQIENNRIDSLFSDSWTLGIGGEYKLTDIFNVRAGFGFETSPYSSRSDVLRYSGGVGWRWKSFYLDLAYLYEDYEEDYRPYQSSIFPTTDLSQSNNNHRIDLTIGFKI